MIRGEFCGGKPWARYYAHGDPFPLAPGWIESCLEMEGVTFPRRGVWTAKALNNLALHDANSDFDQLLQGKPPNQPQVAVAKRIVSAFKEAGDMPDGLDGPAAILEMVGTQDLYHGEPSTLAPYSFDKVKVLQSELRPRPLATVVPRFVQGILKRYDSMIERSAEELAEMGTCPITPYWDPQLKASPRELKKLIVQLSRKGLVTFRTGIKERIGMFCVRKKTPEWIRLIIDARRANWAHRPPPTTRLATPRAFLDLQFSKGAEGQPCAFGLEADVCDCFYNFVNESTASWFGIDLPMSRDEWIRQGWQGGTIYDDASGGFFEPHGDQMLYPVFRGLCMGWSWALFLANEAVAHITAGQLERPLTEVRDRLPAPSLTQAVTGVYVDNISIIGPSVQDVVLARDKIVQQFEGLGIPLTWSAEEPSDVLETIGVVFDFGRGVAHNKPRRIWRAFLVGKEFLKRRRVSGRLLEIWLGHMTSLFMIFPQALACFFHIYRFLQQNRGRRSALWPAVREEIKMSLGLVWMCRSNLVFDPIRQVDVGDASMSAFALMTTWAHPDEISQACQWREAWRFRPIADEVKKAAESGSRAEILRVLEELHAEQSGPVLDQELKPTTQFGAGLRTQFAAWLAQAADPGSWLRTSAISSQLRAAPNKRVTVEVPAMVPPLDDSLIRKQRYSLLWRKKWRRRDDGHITLKEARVALSSLRRTCRVVKLHGKVKLTLTDNLSCLSAFEKGRASDFVLNQICRTATAYSIACGIKWRLRHVETKRNPADDDSRFDHVKRAVQTQKQGAFPFDRGKTISGKAKPVKPDYPDRGPLPGTSTSVRGSPTAVFGRGTREGDESVHGEAKQSQDASQLSTSQLLADKLRKPSRNKHCCTVGDAQARPNESGAFQMPSQSAASKPCRQRGLFLEVFAGTGRLTAAVRALSGACLEPVELKDGGHFDMRRRTSQLVVLSWLKSGRVTYIHLGTPCTVFSRARHGIRDTERAREKERVGLELALFSAEIIEVCNRYGVKWSLENPRNSRLYDVPVLSQLLRRSGVIRVDLDFCRFGEPYKKPTSIFTNFSALSVMQRSCNHRRHQTVLRGSQVVTLQGKRVSVPKTQAAGAYPLQLAHIWAQTLIDTLGKASKDSELLNLQWTDELKKCVSRRKVSSKSVQSASPKLCHVEQIGEAQKFVVFGQHTNSEAAENQTKLHSLGFC